MLQIHDYWQWPDRFSLVSEWWEYHGKPGIYEETAMPRMAVIVTRDDEPVCLLAASMDNSIGKATLEYGLTAPKQTAGQAREALQFAERALFSALKSHNYGLAQTYTNPGIARTLEKDGWTKVGEVIHLIKTIP